MDLIRDMSHERADVDAADHPRSRPRRRILRPHRRHACRPYRRGRRRPRRLLTAARASLHAPASRRHADAANRLDDLIVDSRPLARSAQGAAALPLQRAMRARQPVCDERAAALDATAAGPCRALQVSAVTAPLLEARVADQALSRQGRRREAPAARGRWCRPDHRRRRKRRPGRRVRLRQVHHGAPARPPDRSDHRHDRARRRATSPRCRRRASSRTPGRRAHPGRVPGPDRKPQSVVPRLPGHRRSAAASARSARRRRDRRARARAPPTLVGLPRELAAALSASAFRRPERARRHRARHCRRALAADPRRADLGARRFRAGGDPESARRTARPARR